MRYSTAVVVALCFLIAASAASAGRLPSSRPAKAQAVEDRGICYLPDGSCGVMTRGQCRAVSGDWYPNLGSCLEYEKPTRSEPPASPCATCAECEDPEDVDPVYLHSGEYYCSAVDLSIPGRGLGFVWSRKYRSRLGPNTAQGNGWDFSYSVSVSSMGSSLNLRDGNSRLDTYQPASDSVWTARGFFREIRLNPDGSYTTKFADTGTWECYPADGSPTSGKPYSVQDRNGNSLSLQYDAQGRLEKVFDTLNREITIAYNPDGFIESVTDFAGRQVLYEYYQDGDAGGSFGDLKSVTTPVVDSTEVFPVPSGHHFLLGKTTTYTYSKGFTDERLNHNLLTITDPEGQTYLTNTYAATTDPTDINFDRIVTQVWGYPGDIISFVYVPITPGPANDFTSIKTIINDRVGNVSEYFFDDRAQCHIERDYTGRWDPDTPTTDPSDPPPVERLRPDEDPDFFETRYEYNDDYLVNRIIYPELNERRNVYEVDRDPNAPPRSRGNLIKVLRLPGPRGGDQDSLVEYYEYDDGMGGCCGTNFVTKYINPRGDSTLYTYDAQGNRIHTQYPIPSIVEDWEYNAYGQMTRHIHPDNGSGSRREDMYTYYTSGPSTGYLREEIIDAPNFALTTTYEYDLVGNPVRIIDPRGHDTRYIYNQLNQVVREISPEVTDGTGIRYITETFYDPNHNMVRVEVANIDEEGNLRPNAWITTTYDYEILNERARQTQEVDPLNDVVTEYEYDANRNLILIRYGEATGGDQDPGTVGAQEKNTLSMEYDERDVLFREIRAEGDPLECTMQYDYDGNGNMERRRQGLEDSPREFLSPYDGYNRLTSRIDPTGNVTSYHYDANGSMVYLRIDGELIDVVGSTSNVRLSEVTYTYDLMDRRTLEEVEFFDPETQVPVHDGRVTTQTEYSDNSQVTQVINDNGNTTATSYDTANRTSTITDAKGNTATLIYDANSNVTQIREVDRSDVGSPDELFVTAYTYDNLNRLVQSVDNANHVTRYTFDSRGNQTTQIDALGNVVRQEYDGLGRLLATLRILTDTGFGSGAPVDTIVTQRRWDDTSRLTEENDDNGSITQYTHDALNRQTARRYADGTVDSSTYDVHDNVMSRVDPNGTLVLSTYDLLNRLIERTIVRGPGVLGTTAETYQYDGLSRIVLAEDDDSGVVRKYDSLSRITSETLIGLSTQTTSCLYDGEGNLLFCTYSGGRQVGRTYDDLERVQTIFDQDTMIATYAYIGPVRVEHREYPKPQAQHTTRTIYSYDWVKRTTGTTHVRDPEGAAEVIDARTYTWDAMSNKVERSDIRVGGPQLTHRYTYDSIYRLVRTTVTNGNGGTARDTEYHLDGVGNRTLVTGDNCPGPYTMDPTLPEPADFQVNQYTTTPCDDRQYDKNGNLTCIDCALPTRRDIVYDYRNQMIGHVNQETGDTASYAYDPLGRCIERIVKNGTHQATGYVYVGWQLVEELDELGNTRASYVYGLYDEVVNMRRGGVRYCYYGDDLCNVMAITDPTATVVERYEYQDYGEPEFLDGLGTPIPGSAIGNPYLFTSRPYDPQTGWYSCRSRFLDPVAGRFTTRDPIGIWGDFLNAGNAYTYAGSSPWTWVDAWGLLAVKGANDCGNWDIAQTNTNGNPYSSEVTITFEPNWKKVCCSEIAFVQNVRFHESSWIFWRKSAEVRANFKNRMTSNMWTIDRLPNKKYGWYGYDNNNTASASVTPGKAFCPKPQPYQAASLWDKPGWNKKSLVWDFETCAICKTGKDKSKVYGCLTWGFDVDSKRQLTSHTAKALAEPSGDFNDAVKKWNDQAKGPVNKRNRADQVALGPFKTTKCEKCPK